MTTNDIEKLIGETVELIAISASSLAEAKPRASRFLVVNAILASFLKDLEIEMAKLKTIAEASKAQAMRSADGKTITEKKQNAELDPSYTRNRENFESLDAQRDWIRNHIKIFENAHLMYRQYSRD